MATTTLTDIITDIEIPGDPITVTRLTQGELKVEITGVSPLIVHRFDEKAKAMLLADYQGKDKAKTREPKDPEAEYNRTRYIIDDGRDGFPSVAFKAAMVNAVSHFDKLTKVLVKQSLFITGEGPDQLVPIVGDRTMREDITRVGIGKTDLRYRAMYWPWSATLDIRFIASSISAETVVALVDAAGMGGVGEWRPSAPKSSTGTYGRFVVKEDVA